MTIGRRGFIGALTGAAATAAAAVAGAKADAGPTAPEGWERLPPRFAGDIAFSKRVGELVAVVQTSPPGRAWRYGVGADSDGAFALQTGALTFTDAVMEAEVLLNVEIERRTPTPREHACIHCGANSWRDMETMAGIECKSCGARWGYSNYISWRY